MEKEFVRHEISLELKQLGFDEPCFYQYVRDFDNYGELIPITSETNHPILRNNQQVSHCSGGDCFAAPLYQQVFRWFREKYELDSYIKPSLLGTKKVYDFYIWFTNKEGERDLFIGMNNEYTYEEAEIECLLKLIEFVKESI
jgi:hypothetical protein